MLAQRVEQHAEAFAVHDEHLASTWPSASAARSRPSAEQLEMLSERVGSARGASRSSPGRDRTDGRCADALRVAELIRSDSTALRGLIEERATTVHLGDGDASPLIASFEEHMKALTMATERQVQAMSRTAEQQVAALATATNAAVERHVSQIEERIDVQLVQMTERVQPGRRGRRRRDHGHSVRPSSG